MINKEKYINFSHYIVGKYHGDCYSCEIFSFLYPKGTGDEGQSNSTLHLQLKDNVIMSVVKFLFPENYLP